ncbi:uncharacterized protein [Diabrotica undecimpunctata]|uniref:uncharacterized protein n=1 Tax=Diabrotica undecimpunctata TaxID=50387 RepID=UPI003B6350BC
MLQYQRRGLRGNWTKENLSAALRAVENGTAVNTASRTYHIPRRTLRRYLEEGKQVKSCLGRKTILTNAQEAELVQRIIRLSQIGYPLTARVLCKCVYRFTELNNIPNPFQESKGIAGRYWLRGFMKRNPQIRPRKAQNLNPARAQKLNKFIVKDHFTKLEGILREMDILDKPERIYNVDEKDCTSPAESFGAKRG